MYYYVYFVTKVNSTINTQPDRCAAVHGTDNITLVS